MMAEGLKNRQFLSDRRRRWIAVTVGTGLVAGTILLFRAPNPAAPPVAASKVDVALMPLARVERDPVAEEKAEFGDPTPLFMPTPRNSSEKPLPRREFAGSFVDFQPRFTFEAAALNLELTAPIAVPVGPVQDLAINSPGNPSLGIGRVDLPVPSPASRQARVEVFAEDSGRRVGQYDLPPGAVPSLEGRQWQYLDLMAAVNAAGLAGPLVSAQGLFEQGGNYFPPLEEKAVNELENYLTHDIFLGARLAPGFYRISVGP